MYEQKVFWFRLQRSGLVEKFKTVEECAKALCGVQAQIHSASAISIWNRTNNFDLEAFGRALYEEKRVVKIWGQRNTLHIYPVDDWPLINAANQSIESWWKRAYIRDGGNEETYTNSLNKIDKYIKRKGLINRAQLRDRNFALNDNDNAFSSWGGILIDLVNEGKVCQAATKNGKSYFAHRSYWLPEFEWKPPEKRLANYEITRRYLKTYGPISPHDLAYWRGVRLGEAREWLFALKDEIYEIKNGRGPRFILKEDLEKLQNTPPPQHTWPLIMLYRFDPLLLAHKEKDWIINCHNYKKVWTAGGHVEGVVINMGEIIGTWRYEKDKTLRVRVNFFNRPCKDVKDKVVNYSHDLAQFFSLDLESCEFAIDHKY